MTSIATICARGGSVGVPGKNIRMLLGKPLIVHTIEQAQACAGIDRIFVSTDDPLIAEVALNAGAEVPFLRPAVLAGSDAPKIPVIQHLVAELEKASVTIDRIVDLDPTSPLRLISDIDACIEMLDGETGAVITAYPAEKNPYFNMVEVTPDGSVSLVKPRNKLVTSRQEAPVVYAMNASIYVWHRHTLDAGIWGNRVRLYVMPRERSIDIDSQIDFQLVELFMQQQRTSVS